VDLVVVTARAPSSSRVEPLGRLAPREGEVPRLLAEGRTADEIAVELVISSKTVATHVRWMLGKLGVHSRTQAGALAYGSGFLAAGL
jgi:DNA-binding NarL/FixJ family response regulator